MKRSTRIAAIAGALVLAQALAVWLYLRIERGRRVEAPFTVATLPGSAAPPLIVERRDGSAFDVAQPAGRVRIVHFWATWCVPCRTELPELLRRVREVPGIELVAVSVDDDWDVVRSYFPAGPPDEVVRSRDPEAHRRYGTQGLPDSYVLSSAGRLMERIAGAREWSRPSALRYLRALPERIR